MMHQFARWCPAGVILFTVVSFGVPAAPAAAEMERVAACPGGCNDGNPCTKDFCVKSTNCVPYCNSYCAHTPDDGARCDDADPCTTGDTCVGGQCTGDTATCDDGNLCTRDSCVAETGACSHGAIGCDDGDPCTSDSCDPALGCVWSPSPSPLAEAGPLELPDAVTLTWMPVFTAAIHNTYRGTIPALGEFAGRSPSYDHVCFESDDAQGNGATISVDTAEPPPGTVFYYLVNAEAWPNCQGSLGTASNGTPRLPLELCPTPPP